jgi:hypothetical protein
MNRNVYFSVEPLSRTRRVDDDDDLMIMDDELSVVDIFDPLRPCDPRKTLPAPVVEQPVSFFTPSFPVEPDQPPKPVTPTPPALFPYPIKLRLKQRAYPEMKHFSQFVQQILDEQQSKQVEFDPCRIEKVPT